MKQILIIEDRAQRQEEFLEKAGIEISKYDFIDNAIGEKYTSIKENLLKDTSILNKYDVIVSHRSAFEKEKGTILDSIKDYCEKNQKYLILFSGGISTLSYKKTPYELLSLNSKDFYSKNLKLFLDENENNNKINLLLLAFGEKWKLNHILNVLEKINKLDNVDFDDFDHFDDETDIKTIDNFINLEKFRDENEINLDLIINIKKVILEYINQQLGIYYA